MNTVAFTQDPHANMKRKLRRVHNFRFMFAGNLLLIRASCIALNKSPVTCRNQLIALLGDINVASNKSKDRSTC